MSEHRRPNSQVESEAPETLEGWYVLHDSYHIDWSEWYAMEDADRQEIIAELKAYLATCYGADGDTALFRIIGQKADIMFIHYRRTPSDLEDASQALRLRSFYELLKPAGSYISVIEASLYEATARARGTLARRGLTPDQDSYHEAFATEINHQRKVLEDRVFRAIPGGDHLCFYPMNKKRGEQENWYTLTMDERRDMMRGHGALGRKYHDTVTQVISGSIGFDDWEWGVDLHADDPVVFKKLIYEMRFDPVSAKYAEFGTFYLGVRQSSEDLDRLLAG